LCAGRQFVGKRDANAELIELATGDALRGTVFTSACGYQHGE
jgi:hypothetical protein